MLALNARQIRTEYNTSNPLVHVSFVQPPWYLGDEKQYRIGYTPWESTGMESSWEFYMNNMSEIWTPSPFCKKVFEDNGVTVPITVIPHGINPNHYPIRYDHELGDKFTFFHVGGPTERKGAQRVFDAFLDLFDGNPDVELLMKSTGPSEARWREPVHDKLHNISYHPQVRVYEAEATVEEMKDLYWEADCFVYPSRGEGFAFNPFNAIASGIPTICTNATAMADFAELSIPLDFEWTEGFGIHLGKWADPSPTDLRDKMLYAYKNWELEKKRALTAAEHIHATQSWGNIAELVETTLAEKLDLKAE